MTQDRVLVPSWLVWCNRRLWVWSNMLRPYIGLVAGTLLGGCSSTFFFLPDTPTPLESGPADYQVLVAKDLRHLKDRETMGPFEISPLRQTQLAQPGDWFACVRTSIQDRPTHIAVFMREGRVIDRRQAVVIDGCAQEQFQPLPKVEEPRAEPPKPAEQAKPRAADRSPPTEEHPRAEPSPHAEGPRQR